MNWRLGQRRDYGWGRQLLKRLPYYPGSAADVEDIGWKPAPPGRFNEQYCVQYNDGVWVNVYVQVPHGREKRSHWRAGKLAKRAYQRKGIARVLYA